MKISEIINVNSININLFAENKKAVIDAAKKTEEVRGGYWRGKTNYLQNIEENLEQLQSVNKEAWAKFLFSLQDLCCFADFKKLSPFLEIKELKRL